MPLLFISIQQKNNEFVEIIECKVILLFRSDPFDNFTFLFHIRVAHNSKHWKSISDYTLLLSLYLTSDHFLALRLSYEHM